MLPDDDQNFFFIQLIRRLVSFSRNIISLLIISVSVYLKNVNFKSEVKTVNQFQSFPSQSRLLYRPKKICVLTKQHLRTNFGIDLFCTHFLINRQSYKIIHQRFEYVAEAFIINNVFFFNFLF